MKKAIGIYGGSFDPFHSVHAMIAKAALRRLPIERLLVVPTARPWHKERAHASLDDRLEQCRTALADLSKCEVLEDPIRPGEVSTTAALLKFLQKKRRRPLIFIIGGDAFADLHEWKRKKEVLGLASWAVVPRAGYQKWKPRFEGLKHKMVSEADDLVKETGLVWRWNLRPPPLSSSEIRKRASKGKRGWERDLPQKVAEIDEFLYLYGKRTRS